LFKELDEEGILRPKMSPLYGVPGIGMVTSFPNESMHGVYLGVVRYILRSFLGETYKIDPVPRAERRNDEDYVSAFIGNTFKQKINKRLAVVARYRPTELDRELRPFKDINQWKATDFRQFIYYNALVIFDGVASTEHRKILFYLQLALLKIGGFQNTPVPERKLNEAHRLIEYVVFLIRKVCCYLSLPPVVHNLLHIVEDCRHFNCHLDNLSAFPYENHMSFFKKMFHGGFKKLCQLQNRISEYTMHVFAIDSDGKIIRDDKGKPVKQGLGPKPLGDIDPSKKRPCIVKTRRYIKYARDDVVFINKFQDSWATLQEGNDTLIVRCVNFTCDRWTNEKRVHGHRARIVMSNPAAPLNDSRSEGIYKFRGEISEEEVWPVENLRKKLYVMPDLRKIEKRFPNFKPEDLLPDKFEKFGDQSFQEEFPWVGITLRHQL